MALTPTEEGQIRDILTYYSETLDLAGASTAILAALGYGDVRVIDLPAASPLNGTEVMYLAQAAADVKATLAQFATYMNDNFIDPILDAALADFQDQIDAAIASMQAQINQSLNEPKNYFYGQF